MNVVKVYVSPLRRAVESAYYLFKNHPNFENIRFILTPQLREILMEPLCIPIDIAQLIKNYGPLFPRSLDYSLI